MFYGRNSTLKWHKSTDAVSVRLPTRARSHPVPTVHTVLIATEDQQHQRTCLPALYCSSHVLFWCSRHMYEDQKTRSAIFEGGEEQSAASLISKCSHGASALQPCRTLCYSASISVCAHLLFQTKKKKKKQFPSCLTPDNIRDIPAASELSQTVRSTWVRTLERQSKKNLLITWNEPFFFHMQCNHGGMWEGGLI